MDDTKRHQAQIAGSTAAEVVQVRKSRHCIPVVVSDGKSGRRARLTGPGIPAQVVETAWYGHEHIDVAPACQPASP